MNKLWPLEDRLCKGAKISHLEIQSAKNPFQGAKFFFKVRKCSKLQEWAAKFPFCYQMIFQTSKWLQNDFQASKWAAKMFLFFHGLQKCFSFPFGCKTWPPSYKMMCKDTLQSQGKLQKCQQSLTTMHLKKRALSLRSHMKSLIPFLTS